MSVDRVYTGRSPRRLARLPARLDSGQLAGFCFAAAVNAALLARADPPVRPERWLVHWVDAAAFIAAGLLVRLVLSTLHRLGLRAMPGALLAYFGVAYAVGLVTLQEDFSHFSQEHAAVLPERLILGLGVGVTAASIPAALLAGRLLARLRAGRWMGLVVSGAALIANDTLLPADYFGVHLYIAWSAATFAGASLSGSPLLRRAMLSSRWRTLPRRRRLILASAGVSAFAATTLVPPPARVSLALSRQEGSAFHRQLSRVRVAAQEGLVPSVDAQGEWFRDRRGVEAIPPGPALLPNDAIVILITVDALRADVVGSGKYDAQLPVFTRLRNESVWFSQARAAGTLTKVSLSALFMGTYFSQQYWTPAKGDRAHAPRRDPSPRFPELLQKAGVRTVSYQSIKWLHNDNGVIRGFDEEHYVSYPRSASYYTPSHAVFEKLLPAVEALPSGPAFVYVHLTDPHAPYKLGEKRRGSAFDKYLAEVAFVDTQLGQLLELLETRRFRRRTLLILSADHGEAFGEHGSRTHGTTLYDETLRVPLLFRLPERHHRRIDTPVGLIDVGPTILDVLQRPTPGHYMGQSLAPFLRGETPALTRPLLAETRFMRALVDQSGLKVIDDPKRDSRECYDLKKDPEELDNLADSSAEGRALLARLRALLDIHRLRRPGYEPPFVR